MNAIKSVFEKYPDKFLFKIINDVKNEVFEPNTNYKRVNLTYDLIEEIKPILKLYEFDVNFEDIDFILELLKLNYDKLPQGKTIGKLLRPEAAIYSFDVDVSAIHYVGETYRHKVSTYSENPMKFVEALNESGNFAYFEGNMINSEIFDVEVNEVSFDEKTFTKL